MHWWQPVVAVVSAFASWRWAIKPIRHAWRKLLELLEQIRDSSGGVQKLARELEALSGAIVHLTKEILEVQGEHSGRLEDLAELYVDLVAAVARLSKRVAALEGPRNDTD